MKGKKKDINEEKEDRDSTVNAHPEKELIKEELMKKRTSPPFPQALHGKKGIKNASEILEVLNQVKVNIPLLDMIKQVPTYAKFLKDLYTIKRGLNVNKKAFLTEQVSAIIQCKSHLKYKDPGCPTISVMIGGKVVEKALLDLGASVNLLPYSVYKQLGLGELKPTSITLSLADRSVKIPRGIIEDVLVQVDNFYYPVDFVVLDTDPLVKEANYVPIILGRPFLATSNAIINCRNGLMQLTFGNMMLELNIFHMSKKLITLEEEEGPKEVCIIDTLVEEHCDQNMQDELNESLEDLEEGLSETADVLATLQGWRRKEEILPLFNKEEGQDDVTEEFPKLNLKPLPMELKYTYLEENNQCPVVISSSLTGHQEISLLEVLKRCKKAIGWQISDLKGISLCPWVSPTQVVPKKSGITWFRMKKAKKLLHASLQIGGCWRESLAILSIVSWTGTQGISKLKLMLKIRRRSLSHVRLEHTPTKECLLVYAMHLQHSKDVCLVSSVIWWSELWRCIEKDLVLNWEKCHFMVRQGIVLGHIISEKGIEVDKAKVELIVKLPSPTTVKGVRQFLGHVGSYRRFIQDFSKLSMPLCELLAKDAKSCTWPKRRWEALCDLLCKQNIEEAQRNYTTIEKELLAMVFALDKFRAYLVGSFIIVFTDHSALKYLLTKQDAKARLIKWILLLQEFDLQIKDKKGVENVVVDHLSRLAIAHNSHVLPINDDFPEESLMLLEKAPSYAHIANYLVTGEVPSEWKAQDRKHFFTKIHAYCWEEPFLFKYYVDQIIRKCVPEEEQ
ncbi:Retrovirus-related Pol polyprotein from transposon opus [Vitis vinifera]|uniref:RNA-directed DNA polymerase n=1 Tax=Vitis vinifera TaxID=29760 RepID=A0A438BMC9_VITVI|nr:Retrovirus-related Pol polyprotein from transposon opus [Vitis vinifera]